MGTYAIELNDSEVKAMELIVGNVQEWADNALKNRARIAIEEIYNMEVARMNADPSITSIPADKNQVVLDADIESVNNRNDRLEKEVVDKNK